MKKIINIRYTALSLFVIVAAISMPFSGAHAQTQDVTLALDIIVNGTHAPFIVAVDKGYYKDAGLKVEIVRGYGSGDTVKKVAAKMATFGICDFGTMVTSVAREKTPVKALAVEYARATLGVFYLKGSGIKVPKDLEGRKIGRSAGGASANMLPLFLNSNNLDRKKITEVVIDSASFVPMFLSKQVDAVLQQSVHVGRYQKALDDSGIKDTVMYMLFADYGLDTYGNVIITHNDLIEKTPLLVKKFVQASIKGLTYSFGHPEESVSIIEKLYPEVTKERAIEELLAIKALWTEDVLKSGLGFMTPERTKISVESIAKALNLGRVEPINVYNNSFVK